MQSMTKKELENPDLVFNRKRIDRIAKGSGTTAGEVRELLKQYRQSKKMMKMFKGEQDINKMMKKMGGKIPGLGMWNWAKQDFNKVFWSNFFKKFGRNGPGMGM